MVIEQALQVAGLVDALIQVLKLVGVQVPLRTKPNRGSFLMKIFTTDLAAACMYVVPSDCVLPCGSKNMNGFHGRKF